MTAAELLAAARAAGLTVASGGGGTLHLRGPRTAGPIARQLLDRKDEVLRELDDPYGLGPWSECASCRRRYRPARESGQCHDCLYPVHVELWP